MKTYTIKPLAWKGVSGGSGIEWTAEGADGVTYRIKKSPSNYVDIYAEHVDSDFPYLIGRSKTVNEAQDRVQQNFVDSIQHYLSEATQ